MVMQKSMVLLALVSCAAAQVGETMEWPTVNNTYFYHYLGRGRGAQVLVNAAAPSCLLELHTVYAPSGSQSCAKPDAQTSCATEFCIPQRSLTAGNEPLCVAVQDAFVGDDNLKFYQFPRGTNMATGTQFEYKSHGGLEYEWFVRYKVATVGGGCEGQKSLTLQRGKAFQPEQGYCVGPNDVNSALPNYADPDDHPFFAEGAELPRHPGVKYAIESRVVNSNDAVNAPQAARNVGYFDLGKGPVIDLRCLRWHISSAREQPAPGCESLELGFGTNTQVEMDLELVEAPDCREATILSSERSCCHYNSKPAECAADINCMYVEEVGECYNTSKIRSLDLSQSDVVVSSSERLIINSALVNAPDTSLITRPNELQAGWSNQLNRRWFLRARNRMRPASSGNHCQARLELSYISQTTGGICEPSARALCDMSERRCQAAVDYAVNEYQWPRYWKQHRARSEFGEILNEDEYHTCNCLKQKEVCYRKNGCLSTKRYQLILQNCMEAGCGNVCNSGAAVHVSAAVLLFAVLALLL